jgi:hypothetical protein
MPLVRPPRTTPTLTPQEKARAPETVTRASKGYFADQKGRSAPKRCAGLLARMRGAGGKKKPARRQQRGRSGIVPIGEGSIGGEPVLSRLAPSIWLVDSADAVRWFRWRRRV